jgi:HSP20 family protein
MRSRFTVAAVPSEVSDFAEEVQRVFLELSRSVGADLLAGQCSPAIDVFERDEAIEIVVDLPGVEASAVRVVAKGDTVLIVGEKTTRRPHGESSFHLVERDFGRFARAVRVVRACDMGSATARLVDGELRVSMPKIVERRRRPIPIAISRDPSS